MNAKPIQAPSRSDEARTFQVDSLPVMIFSTRSQLADAAALEAGEYLRETIARQGSARVILATGNSQIDFLGRLIALNTVEWSRVVLFHMDEYLGIPAEHTASFRRYMKERVEHRVRPQAFHYLEGDALEPIDECDRYTNLLRVSPIDLCCLGIGENGHIAFNDPPVANFDDRRSVKIVKLDLACRQQQAGEGHFPTLQAVPEYALTLTIPALCSAKRMICISPERRKAKAVRAALKEPIDRSCPASILRRQSHARLYLDAESASLL